MKYISNKEKYQENLSPLYNKALNFVRKANANKWMHKAAQSVIDSDIDDTMKIINSCLKLTRQSEELRKFYYIKASCYMISGKYKEAIKVFKQIKRLPADKKA